MAHSIPHRRPPSTAPQLSSATDQERILPDPALTEQMNKMRKSDPAGDSHAGERETSTLLYLRPDLVKQDRSKSESGASKRVVSMRARCGLMEMPGRSRVCRPPARR